MTGGMTLYFAYLAIIVNIAIDRIAVSATLAGMFRDWAQQRTRELGKRQRELAELLHIDPSGVSRLLAGERQLTASEIPLVARFFEVSVDELLALLGGAPALAPPPPAAMPASAAAELSVLSRAEMPRDVPVFGTAVGGKDG